MRQVRFSWKVAVAAGVAAVGALLLVTPGCDEPTRARRNVTQAGAKGGLIEFVAENLDRLEQFEPLSMLSLICERLNQWSFQERPEIEWQVDPLVDELPAEYRTLSGVVELDRTQFRPPSKEGILRQDCDGWYLQEAVWLRNISNIARADKFDDLEVAERLFDWTIRNIQLDADPPPSQAFRRWPYETLLLSRGSALDRAWIFMLLARQQGLDVVLLSLPDEREQSPRPCLTALLTGGQLYLFDCRLGLPIPGPNGQGVATLEQAIADPSILRRLDLDDANRYPVTADDLKKADLLIEGSTYSLSRRMALVESRLTGKHRLVLTSPGSKLASKLNALPSHGEVRLWTRPFEVSAVRPKLNDADKLLAGREMLLYQFMPTLMAGRARYFKGQFNGDDGAKQHLLPARPSQSMLDNYRLPAKDARQLRPEDVSRFEASQVVLLEAGKHNATLWLGLITFEEKKYAVAADWFGNQILEAYAGGGPFAGAARFNLARCYEAMGEPQRAIDTYEADRSPQSYGNKLRARWLREGLAGPAAPSSAPSPESPPPQP